MKIFNWVQKRLNPNIFRESGFGRSSVKKGDPCVGSELDSVLESWKDGILTIGTFGYDPLKHFSQHDHHHQLFPQDSWSQEEDDHQHNDDDEEYHTCINNNNNVEAAAGKLEEEDEELNPLIWNPATADDVQSYYSADTTDDEIITSRSSATSSRRTTLADLFVAESESESSSSSTVVLSNSYIAGDKKKKQLFETSSCTDQSFAAANQSGCSLPDKFINHIAAAKAEDHDNRRPVKIKKLHQLMKKILKKKIYPEDNANANAAQVNYQKKHVQAAAAAAATAHHESLCLLNTGAAADAMP